MHSRGQVRGQCCIVPNSRLKVNQNKKCFKIKSVIFSLFADALRTCSEFEGGTSFPAERGAKRNLVVARPPTRLARKAWSPLCYKSIEFGWCPSWRHRTVGFRRVSSCFGLYTGSRGDMFVVRTSKPVENLWKNRLFWSRRSRYSFVTHSIWPQTKRPRACKIGLQNSCLGRPLVTLRATCRAPARIWLAVIDFQNREQQSRSGSDKKRRNC